MIFYSYKYKDGFWFRLFGYGFSFSKTALFSDRYFNRKKYLGPKMAIIELHEGLGTRPDQKGWQTPWVDDYFKGYKKIYKDNINSIYLKD